MISQFEDLDIMLHHTEEPFITPNLFLYWNLYRSVQASEVRVILDGFLGDNVVSHGSRYITELAATGHWVKLVRELNSTSKALGGRRRTLAGLARQFVLTPLISEPVQRARFALVRPDLPATPFSRYINRDFARGINWMERAREYGADFRRTPAIAKKEHYAELNSGSFPAALEVINKASSAFGVTARFPFTDRRLVEYCLAVPVTRKYRDGWTRVIQRDALRQYLPPKIYTRYGKTYLNRIFNRSLFMLGRQELDSIIHERLQTAAPWVNVEAIRHEYARITKGSAQGQYSPNNETSLAIWYAVILTRWHELEKQD
jgi:asparagine synthase (glutamine-hydrolysing)